MSSNSDSPGHEKRVPGRVVRKEGKMRMQATIDALRSELAAREQSISQCRWMLSQSIQRQAAIDAATNTALAVCMRHNCPIALAHELSISLSSALQHLAASVAYTVLQVPVVGGERHTHTALGERPGAEAVASAAPGLTIGAANTTPPGSEAVASEANDLGQASLDDDGFVRHSTTSSCSEGFVSAGVEHYDIFDAADSAWLRPTSALGDGILQSSADAAAGAVLGAASVKCAHPEPLCTTVGSVAMPDGTTSSLKCAHPEPLHLPVVQFVGVGSSLTTPSAADVVLGKQGGPAHELTTQSGLSRGACGHDQCGTLPAVAIDAPAKASPCAFDAISEDVQTDFNSQNLANTVVPPHSRAYDGIVSSTCPPGSSNPGDQSGAVDFSFYSGKTKKSSGTDAGSELPTAKTAPLDDECGSETGMNSFDGKAEALCSTASISQVGHVGNLKDFNSANIANTSEISLKQCGPLPEDSSHLCGPLPPTASPRAFDAISRGDFNSQHIANTGSVTTTVTDTLPPRGEDGHASWDVNAEVHELGHSSLASLVTTVADTLPQDGEDGHASPAVDVNAEAERPCLSLASTAARDTDTLPLVGEDGHAAPFRVDANAKGEQPAGLPSATVSSCGTHTLPRDGEDGHAAQDVDANAVVAHPGGEAVASPAPGSPQTDLGPSAEHSNYEECLAYVQKLEKAHAVMQGAVSESLATAFLQRLEGARKRLHKYRASDSKQP